MIENLGWEMGIELTTERPRKDLQVRGRHPKAFQGIDFSRNWFQLVSTGFSTSSSLKGTRPLPKGRVSGIGSFALTGAV